MAHAAVHWHLDKTWLRGIVQPRGGFFSTAFFWIKLLVSFILPIFIPFLVEFEGTPGIITSGSSLFTQFA